MNLRLNYLMVNWEFQKRKICTRSRLGHRFGLNYKGGFDNETQC